MLWPGESSASSLPNTCLWELPRIFCPHTLHPIGFSRLPLLSLLLPIVIWHGHFILALHKVDLSYGLDKRPSTKQSSTGLFPNISSWNIFVHHLHVAMSQECLELTYPWLWEGGGWNTQEFWQWGHGWLNYRESEAQSSADACPET